MAPGAQNSIIVLPSPGSHKLKWVLHTMDVDQFQCSRARLANCRVQWASILWRHDQRVNFEIKTAPYNGTQILWIRYLIEKYADLVPFQLIRLN